MILATTAAAAALLLASYAGVAGLVAQRFTSAQRRLPALGAGPGGCGARSVGFPARDGLARIAAWYLPVPAAEAAPAPRGAIVFVHGKDACRGDELKGGSRALAQCLNEAGFAVLMIDLRGHGASSGARLTYGQRERFDVLGAVDWLRARGHARIGVLGASMGAASTLLAAADEPAIAAVVADSAFADFGQMIERQYRKLSGLPGFLLPGTLAIGRLLTGVALQRVRPLEAASRLGGRPCLLIHSAGDRFIPAADAKRLAAAAGAELWITESEGHIGSYRAEPAAYTERVLAFFARALG
ncbi:MAG: alpha/beta fold hydrolase [Burkholderiales bacterium]|nr:alpha/beta fold hydrolase [Burkholderiales bacterium]